MKHELDKVLPDLAEHQLFEEGTGTIRSWVCRNPNRFHCWYRVVSAPNALIVYGDLVTDRIVYHPGQRDMLSWLRGAVRSPGYLAQKVTGDFDQKMVFDPDLVDDYLYDELDDSEDWDSSVIRNALERWHSFSNRTVEDAAELLTDPYDLDGLNRDTEVLTDFFRPHGDVVRSVAALIRFEELLV